MGRRVILGMLGLGAAGIAVGSGAQNVLTKALGPVRGQIGGLIPAAGGFRYYSVVDSVPSITSATYTLKVNGLVTTPRTFTFQDLQAMPQTHVTKDFQCVTGWRVPGVQWSGVALPDLLDAVGAHGSAITFSCFDGAYTESLTMDQARRRDVLVATSMLGGPVSHDHGGPVRLFVAPMYGYKSAKWLSGIEVTNKVTPGFWEVRGYDVDGWVGRSNGRNDVPTS